MGPLSSEAERAKRRHSGSKALPLRKSSSGTASQSPFGVRRLSAGFHGLACLHSLGVTGWPSKWR